jgi:magnesium-transporting ATPase (P-type)
VIALERGPALCDAVILRGTHVVLDESALTGEVTPVAKRELDEEMRGSAYASEIQTTNTIFAGTNVQEVDEGDLALVTATGSFTAKGGLLTAVLSFERHKPLFEDDLLIVVLILVAETFVLSALVVIFLGKDVNTAYFDGT